MKRAMTTSVVAGLLGAVGFTPAVLAADATIYGSVRSGIVMNKPDGGDTTWDLGSADVGDLGSADKLYSRIGIKASTEFDGGMTAGLHIEKRLDNWRSRHQNVYLSGAFGKLTLGQQGSPFDGATGWDPAYFLGGNNRVGGPARRQGVKYSSSLGGPFNFEVMVTDDNSEDGGQGQGADHVQVAGSLSYGIVNLTGAYKSVDDKADYWGGTIGGSFEGLGWKLGYVSEDPETGSGTDGFGGNVSYSMGGGTAYLYYDDKDADAGDASSWVAGYLHTLAPGVMAIAEYRDNDNDDMTKKHQKAVVGLRVDF